MEISISREDYLKVIAEAESEGESIIPATLVRWLNVTAPAAAMAVKRLKRDNLITVSREGQIRLTGEGRAIADRLLRRHHLLERMLDQIFHFQWYLIHEEADRMEHAISEEFERKLVEMLGEDGACPHGNRLGRESPEARRQRGWRTLDQCGPGDTVTFKAVFERDRALLEHLDHLGLRPGVTVTVRARNWDDTIGLASAAGEVVLGLRAAALIWVTNASAADTRPSRETVQTTPSAPTHEPST